MWLWCFLLIKAEYKTSLPYKWLFQQNMLQQNRHHFLESPLKLWSWTEVTASLWAIGLQGTARNVAKYIAQLKMRPGTSKCYQMFSTSLLPLASLSTWKEGRKDFSKHFWTSDWQNMFFSGKHIYTQTLITKHRTHTHWLQNTFTHTHEHFQPVDSNRYFWMETSRWIWKSSN